MFQQRHFEAIAQMMQELHPGMGLGVENLSRRQWTLTINALSKLFAQSNSRFNLGRFERACEPGANVRAHNISTGQPITIADACQVVPNTANLATKGT